ncbi:transposon Tf2-12 polyprotein [Tanacetum coccineum]
MVSCLAISSLFSSWKDKIKLSVAVDGKLQGLIDVIKEHPHLYPKYTLEDGLLLRNGRLVVGEDDELRTALIEFFHASAMGAFMLQHKESLGSCIGKGYKLRFWSIISMDFIDGLPKSEGYSTILVVVDKLSKFGHFIPLKRPYKAADVASLFLQHITKLYGMPEKIISDRDPIFLSNFWKELFKAHKTNLAYSTAYHPQSDGQTEVVNRCVETYLRCFSGETPTGWSKWLPLAQYWYNTSHHSSLQMSPYQALFGQTPPSYIHYHPKDSPNQAIDTLLRDREAVF